MKCSNRFLITFLFLAIFVGCLSAQDLKVIARGNWGKKSDQLGVNLLAPGVLPTAPFMGPGGYDVDSQGRIWIADSVNRQIKSFFNREWRETMVNSEGLGEVTLHENKLYVISRNPNGFLIFDTDSEKVEKLVKVEWKSPGRIAVLRKGLIAIEELAGGVWLIEDEKTFFHPAIALQACGEGKFIFGLQKDLLSDNLHIIRAELAQETQEPEVTGIFENEDRSVFAKLAGISGGTPVLAIINANAPGQYRFIRIGDKAETEITLPVFDGPYLQMCWKLCSNGKFVGFAGEAAAGFKIYLAEKNF